ncbi:phosphatase PAP2 family protein [Haloglomus halophilum]|uniref:phosphatase PAP2 family protein n=1 Tax=Haloglomus halophilum TaxID=2962672 RepID=UPI0020C98E34|nr:phosphatase PAP2 family protein [Haloglomus halophilum]
MSLAESLVVVLGGVVLLNAGAAALVLHRERPGDLRTRLREAAPYLGFLGGVLAVNKVAREYGPELSWVVGWNITHRIYSIEGTFVAHIQSVATPWLTTYFSAVYLFGYTVLLTFPFLAYLLHPQLRYLKRAAVAFGLNYGLGVVCYTLFVSYGPRNRIPDAVEPLLYAAYPRAQIVTSQVNANTNVFPSLHTSLSVTVALLAWRTRRRYPRWTAIAVPLAASVVVSTMYLGIHWATDVVAGIALGVGSVLVAEWLVE